MICGRVTGVTGKLKGGCFYGVRLIMLGGEILACYEKEKGIRRSVIKIHKLRITGGLWYSKRCPFAQ